MSLREEKPFLVHYRQKHIEATKLAEAMNSMSSVNVFSNASTPVTPGPKNITNTGINSNANGTKNKLDSVHVIKLNKLSSANKIADINPNQQVSFNITIFE